LTATGTERLFPLYRLPLDGITLGTPVQLFTVQKNLNGFKDSLAPKVIDGWTVQDINGFRTVTYSLTYPFPLSDYDADSGVYISGGLVTLPSSARFSSSENISISTSFSGIVGAQMRYYNRSTGAIDFHIYSHASFSSVNVTVNIAITGKI
jgi:hypothetical protein